MTMQDALREAQRQNDELLKSRNDRWYPQFHIAARAGWINDPNGLSYHNGRYHVYFQHHPAGTEWGPMHWGHVSSADLVTWRREPIALAPSIEEDRDGVFSGSAVSMPDGTLMAYYTGHVERVEGVREGEQHQILATSHDDGITFAKERVILSAPGHPDFRDPKVWQIGDTWYMVVGASSKERRGQVWLYSSTDMRDWTFDRVIYEDPDPDVYMLECPDLFELDGKWVMLYGPMTTAQPRGYANRNGHNTGCVVGTWAPGEVFTTEHEFRPADWGHSYYAPQTFVAPDGRRIVLGWLGGFTLPLASQAADGWSGQMTLFRELRLGDDGRLRANPVREVEQLRRETIDFGAMDLPLDEEKVLLEDADGVEIELEVDLSESTAEQIGLNVHRTSEGRATWVAYDDLAGRVTLDRRTTGPTDGGYRSAPFDGGSRLKLRVFVDRGSVEVFTGDGAEVLSSQSFPVDGPRSVSIKASMGDAKVTTLRVHRLGTIWESPDR